MSLALTPQLPHPSQRTQASRLPVPATILTHQTQLPPKAMKEPSHQGSLLLQFLVDLIQTPLPRKHISPIPGMPHLQEVAPTYIS